MIDSLQALEWGLVDYLADSKAGESAVMRADCLARSMSQGGEHVKCVSASLGSQQRVVSPAAPLALMQAKVAITTGFDLGLETALDVEQSCYATLINTQDRKEALMAFQQKRTPQFVGC